MNEQKWSKAAGLVCCERNGSPDSHKYTWESTTHRWVDLLTSSCCSEGAFLGSSVSTSLKMCFGSNSFGSTLSGAKKPCEG